MSKLIPLGGKHAVGAYSHAIVDDDQYEHLIQWKWKAKPNGNGTHVYAVRNLTNPDGSCTTVRMHRVVMDYTGPLDIDHVNRNSVDNRKKNLRVATRSENIKNTFTKVTVILCLHCEKKFTATARGASSFPGFCSEACRRNRSRSLKSARVSVLSEERARSIKQCLCCGNDYPYHKNKKYCSTRCKSKAKWDKWKASGSFPPSVLVSAERSRLYRERLAAQE